MNREREILGRRNTTEERKAEEENDNRWFTSDEYEARVRIIRSIIRHRESNRCPLLLDLLIGPRRDTDKNMSNRHADRNRE